MKNKKLPRFYSATILIISLCQNIAAGGLEAYPDIRGTWISLDSSGADTEAIFTIDQEDKYLSGMFVDFKDGKIVIEAPLIGYIDKQGGVIFDLQFGRVKSTNRLQLSDDGNMLDGTFVNTMGNEGQVHIRRK